MKILLVTFDKEMEKKIRELLKDHQIITAKNGEEALLLNIADDVDLVIYDALAGGIAEDDINKLYEEGFQNVPFIILMDDLFPIDPNNIKPKLKKIISREVEVDKLPQLVEELVAQKGTKEEAPAVQEQPSAAAQTEQTAPSPAAASQGQEEFSWDELMGTAVAPPPKEEAKQEEKPSEETAPAPPQEEKKAEATPQVSPEISLKKQCLVVSFDMPLVERIEKLIWDKCDLHIARSAKQALQKYCGKPFDIIIFDTISGVFAEKGIRDLYEKGGYKDSLYVLLLDEFLPIDVDKLPVKNLRAIKRESELELLPEIVEQAPHITFDKMIEQAATASEGISLAGKEETPAASEQQETAVAAPKLEEEITFPVEEAEKGETGAPSPSQAAPAQEQPAAAAAQQQPTGAPSPSQAAPAAPAVQQPTAPPPTATPAAAPTVQIDEKLIEKLVEQKINEKVIPLVEELIRSRLSEVYIKALVREIIEPQIDETLIKEIVREIAEPLVKEAIEQLLAEE